MDRDWHIHIPAKIMISTKFPAQMFFKVYGEVIEKIW